MSLLYRNPTTRIKHYYEDDKITQQELVRWVVDWVKQSREYHWVKAVEFRCRDEHDIITKVLPQHILDCYNREKGLPRERRRVQKIKEYARKSKKRIHTAKMKFILNERDNYKRDLVRLWCENIGDNKIDKERIQRANFGPLASKKKKVDEDLYKIYGHNYEFIIYAHPSTINRHVDEWCALLIEAKRNVPHWANDPYLIESKSEVNERIRKEIYLSDKPKRWPEKKKIDPKKSDWKRENVDTYLKGKDRHSRQYIDPEYNEYLRVESDNEKRTAREEVERLRKEKLFKDIINSKIKVPPWLFLRVIMFGVDGLIDDDREPEK